MDGTDERRSSRCAARWPRVQFLDLDRPSAGLIYTPLDGAARRGDATVRRWRRRARSVATKANKENGRKWRVVRRPELPPTRFFPLHSATAVAPGPLLPVRGWPPRDPFCNASATASTAAAAAVSTVRSRTFYIRSPLLSRAAGRLQCGCIRRHICLDVHWIAFFLEALPEGTHLATANRKHTWQKR